MKRLFTFLMTISMAVAMMAPASAAQYTYTVRFFSGAHGSFDGQEMVTYTGLSYGSRMQFNINAVDYDHNGKYYPKGIRESGKDNNGALKAMDFPVTQDMDYVVAWGIAGDQVAYTVNYIDEDGNALAEPDVYYGNPGDKPVVSYLYFEGYTPIYRNITGTLSENAADNNWTFEYVKVETPAAATAQPAGNTATTTTVTTTTTTVETQGNGTGDNAAVDTDVSPTPDTTGVDDTEDTGENSGENSGENTGENEAPADTAAPATIEENTEPAIDSDGQEVIPEEILDMDAPLAEFVPQEEIDSDETEETPPTDDARRFPALPIVGGVIGVVILGVVIWLLLKRRKKNSSK